MPTLIVKFTHIDVHDDSDGIFDGAGDFYYDMLISDTSIVSVPREQTTSANSGEKILMNEQRVVSRPDEDPTAFVKISGWVSEKDGGLAWGSDHAGQFEHIYTAANGWGVGTHDVKLDKGDGPSVTVHYVVELFQVSSL